MKVKDLRCHVAPMAGSWLTESVISNPMSIYPEYWEKRSSWFQSMTAAVVEIALVDGTRGFGFAGGGKGTAVAAVLNEQIRALVIGQDAFDTGRLQEQLYRATIFYVRGGLTQCALSAVDIALWDARGRYEGQPVHQLLTGGDAPARESLRVYYTGNDPHALSDFGIRDMKIAIPYGPAHGEQGMAENERVVARAREVLGPEAFLALDIYMSWNVEYTLRMYERIEKYRIAWLEEPVLPDDYRGYAELRRRVNTKVTGGEHEYTLAGFERLIGEGCVDIVQPDIYRAGGVTGLRKIAALARQAGIQMVCHGIGNPTYHLLATHNEALTPFAEYVDIYRGTTQDWVLTDDPRPLDGWLPIGNEPGFGYTLNSNVFDSVPPRAVATIW